MDVFGLAAGSREGRQSLEDVQAHVLKTELREREGTARQSMCEEKKQTTLQNTCNNWLIWYLDFL